jgi:putative ABC transport system permease protein
MAALILAGGFTEWIFWATREAVIESGFGHIQVVRRGFFDAGLADPFRFVLPNDVSVRQIISGTPDLKRVAPKLSFTGLISHGDATIPFTGEGVDPEAERNFGNVSIITDGTGLSDTQPNGIILGRGLASSLGVKVNDAVTLLATTKARGLNGADARVLGLFSTATKAYDDSALRAPLALAQRLVGVPGVHRWVVVLTDTAKTDGAVDALRTQLAGSDLEVVPWYDVADFYKKTVALLSQQIVVIDLIVAVIIVLMISNSFTMSVIERTGEIGTSLAIGVTRVRTLRRFIAEGVAIGLLGGLLGVATGVGLAVAISVKGIPMPPPPGGSQGYLARIIVTWRVAIEALGLGIGTALLASLLPAWRASRLIIVDALRHNK